MNDGEREIWNEMQKDAAPSVRQLSARLHRATKPVICTSCGHVIEVGMLYSTMAFLVDGKFQFTKVHNEPSCKEIHNE